MLRRCLLRQNVIVTPCRQARLWRHTRHASSKTNTKPPIRSRIFAFLRDPLHHLRQNPPTATQATAYAIAFVLFWHIEYNYFFEYNGCYGISMLPTFNSLGDFVLISKYYRRGRGLEVGDIVSFAHPIDREQRMIKRVLGMPGDFVCRDTPGLAAGRGVKMLQVPSGHCWVVGDNLTWSRDSRIFGPLPLALVKGKVIVRFSPWWRPHWLDNELRPAASEDEVD